MYAPSEDEEDALDEEELVLHRAIKDMQALAKNESQINSKRSILPKEVRVKATHESLETVAKDKLDKRGVDTTMLIDSLRKGAQEASESRKRARSYDDEDEGDSSDEEAEDGSDMDEEASAGKKQQFKSRRVAKTSNGKRVRHSISAAGKAAVVETSVAPRQMKQVTKSKKTLERHLTKYAKGGEADRTHYPKLIKHLNSGKSSLKTSTIGR